MKVMLIIVTLLLAALCVLVWRALDYDESALAILILLSPSYAFWDALEYDESLPPVPGHVLRGHVLREAFGK